MMWARRVPVALLLLATTSLALQVSGYEDLYWEGEEDASNEFLEFKKEDSGLTGHLNRIKRQLFNFDFFAPYTTSTTTTEAPPAEEISTDDPDADVDGGDADDLEHGSGAPDRGTEEQVEKTLRVTFVVMEPYRSAYSNRDSAEFQNFSKTIGDGVDLLYKDIPGEQKASLVRIQSRISDEFSCKVTIDIVTVNYDDLDAIAKILLDHIKNRRELGVYPHNIKVSDADFSSVHIDPSLGSEDTCAVDELRCNDNICVSGSARCNGTPECLDGSDEHGCAYDFNVDQGQETEDTTPQAEDCERFFCPISSLSICSSERCDGYVDCPNGEDEEGCDSEAVTQSPTEETTQSYTAAPSSTEATTKNSIPFTCPEGEFSCDGTRCVSFDRRCDQRADCYDGTDEQGCRTESCGVDDFRCPSNDKCIEASRRCDGVFDCPNKEDEENCVCRDDEFQCVSDRSCIEGRKQCDGISHCQDGSDEANCRDPNGKFRCRSGRLIPEYQRCNGNYDCPTGDYSDEQNCPCGDGDFKCDNGNCIPASKHCDRSHDCQDGSDERDCTYGTVCMAFQYKCSSGQCVPAESKCNGTVECGDHSDEHNCPCKRGQFECRDGSCLNIALRCDGNKDCRPDGEDEFNCGCPSNRWQCEDGTCIPQSRRCDGRSDCLDRSDEKACVSPRPLSKVPPRSCPPGSFTCNAGSSVPCATECDDNIECDNGEDEDNCNACSHKCNGICLDDDKICNGYADCPDGSDEERCNHCDGRLDFRCKTGECININQRCNGISECSDDSDELDCNTTMISNRQEPCSVDEFQCNDGSCINSQFYCDGRSDCNDNSDEENCLPGCDLVNEWQCASGSCIPSSAYCDGRADCPDGDDEISCPTAAPQYPFQAEIVPTSGIVERPNNAGGSGYPGNAGGSGYPGSSGGSRYPVSSDGSGYPGNAGGSGYPGNSGGSGYPGSSGGSGYPGNAGGSGYSGNAGGSGYSGNSGGSGYPGSSGGSGYPGNAGGSGYPGNAGGSGYPGSSGGSGYPGSSGGSGSPKSSGESGYPGNAGGSNYPDNAGGGGYPSYREGSGDGCNRNEWRCENGPCIASSRRCDGKLDCPFDSSDEFDCPAGSPIALDLKTYPSQQTVRNGGDVVFQCRDEGPLRARVTWVRENGRPLKPGSIVKNGRLEINQVTMGDSGVYICQATQYLGHPDAELRVLLNVELSPVTVGPPRFCAPHEATCANSQCIPKTSVCDGVFDCSDRSDEDSCHINGKCEPNQMKCDNNKCIFKTWMCDSEDDCGDGSDERNCGTSSPGQCQPVEFTCASGDQCIPKSFHCDGQSDCLDRSDEIGCAPVYVTSPPKPSNVRLNIGETLVLNCSATGTPTPLISWRLNWREVPDVCRTENVQQSGQVTSVLTCPDMQAEYSGAYSCEVLNNKGTIFAVPDSIVFVNKTSVCPPGYFNSDARSQRDCIRCFCFGESTSCKSADLFTFYMATPLHQGARLVGVRNPGDGNIQLDPSITNQYYYQPLRNGATVTKLARYGPNYGDSGVVPYLTLPDSYNTDQLASYGGHINYKLAPHLSGFGRSYGLPDIVIKGKNQTLLHFSRGNNNEVDARFTPGDWEKPSSRGLEPASREDIMMALYNIEMILLRASVNNAGVNITDFKMESAHDINSGLGIASLVEECSCPPGYAGPSCQRCASGYVRANSGQWLGDCMPQRPECPPGTYGDPASGYACRPCPCPLTNRENQFARTCSVDPSGSVVCDCQPGYEGKNCEYCASGYVGNPLVVGDSCQPRRASRCNQLGTSHVRLPDECECKDNVQGRYCDQCRNNSFYLSDDFRHGCALCFCSGVSQQCQSSNLRRKTTTVLFDIPDLVNGNSVKVYSSSPLGADAAVRYNAPVETTLKTSFRSRGISLVSDTIDNRPAIYYWSLPIMFAGDKVTSYGGYLTYTLHDVPSLNYNNRNNAADIQLVSENHLTFHYFGNFNPSPNGTLEASVQFLEKGWQRPDGKEVSREHFLLALADVKAILVKASYTNSPQPATLGSASIDTAEENGNGPPALHVEQCVCPREYIGTSCEDCAPGFTRYGDGLYLEHCGPCECNGHSNMCHPETGVCINCQDNTDGPNCEDCKPGYKRDQANNCVPEQPVSTCNCDRRGSVGPCDARGYCACKQNVEGPNCDTCRPGTFGLDASNPAGCYDCYCSGATSECHEAPSRYIRIPMAAPVFGPQNGGYTLMDVDAQRVIHDQIISVPTQSELMYVFQFPPNEELYWSLPVFPGNRILSYGGTLQLKQKFESSTNFVSEPGTDVILVSDDKSIYWTNPQAISAGQGLTFKVPLTERDWFLLNTATPASRSDMLSVLKNLRRVLVRATLVKDIYSTSIADVSMDTATDLYDPAFPHATGVEICMCPEGYTGTSCESCKPGYYKDQYGCQKCNCNGHDCFMNAENEVVCNCRPPYYGQDCSLDNTQNQDNNGAQPPPPRASVVVQITSPTIKIQDIGSTVNFTCQAQSRMTRGNLPVTWTKDNGYLPQGRTQFDNRLGMLIITNLQITDSGKYICQTTDGVSTAQAYATLRVPSNSMTMPSVEIRSPVKEYFEGERIQLECIASGNPSPTITWQRSSGRPLPLYAEVIDELFIIENAHEEDSGEYRCRASNAFGSADRTAMVTVRPRPSQQPRDKLTVSQQAPTISEGQNTRVVCTGTANVPAGSIDWVRQDGEQLQTNVRSINGVLYIDYARLDNQGVYICQTTSYDVQPVLVMVKVIPLGTPAPGEASNITVTRNRLTIPTGGSGTVDCSPTGYPLPLIRWRKMEGEFGRGTSQRDNTLIVMDASEEDQGYYMCEGTVDNTPVANIYVYVEIEKRERPDIEIWPQGELAVTLGSPFELRCRVKGGIPEPVVTWSRSGGRHLSQSTEILPNNILRFERIDVNDEGEYSCTATNEAGTASASAVIKVRSPPEVTVSPTDYITAVYGDPVTVECRANGYPQPVVSIKSSDRVELVGPNPGMAVLHIQSVSDRDDGEYICTASSPAGTIEEQFAISVERGDGGYGGGEGSGDIDIERYPPPSNVQPSDLIAIEGQETRIGCDASSEMDVQWTREDRFPLQQNAQQIGDSLIIRSASKQDSGQYVCNLIDPFTGEIVRSATTSLVVMAAPRITLQPPTQTVHPGESPTVECVVDGDEIQEIVWRPLTRPFSSRVEVRRSTLIFNRIEVEDAGKYECFAKNRVANTSATAEVVVSEETDRAPSESHDNEQRAHVGAAVQLSCNVQAPPAGYRITWTKDGRQIPRSVIPRHDGSLYIRLAQKSDSGHYVCNIQDRYGRRTSNYINLHIDGDSPAIVTIDQPHRQFRVGDNVEVMCRARSRGDRVAWERYGTNQFVDSRTFGGGAVLMVNSVQESDAGVYRCTGTDPYGRSSFEDFTLEVQPGNRVVWPAYPPDAMQQYTVHQGDSIDMPCSHNLESPYSVEWRREYTPLQPEVRASEPTLHLNRITEADAGTYVCRVSNSRTAVETRAVLRVVGVVPRFDGSGWISLPTLQDAYKQFDIEISFKPIDDNGLILYNSEKDDGSGDYLALRLINGVPQFLLEVGGGPLIVDGDRPLQLNTWHTIRISKTNSKVIMDVDNNGPNSVAASSWDLLELRTPLYIGGVPDFQQLPSLLSDTSGFIGCVSMLVLGNQEKNIMLDRIEHSNIKECDSCTPNLCYKNGVCQEARNERGYVCLCAPGFAGLNCDRTGEACKPGLCGPGKCTDTADGYKCACPVTYTGKNCDVKQNIEYPAFTGSAYLAFKPPKNSRYFRMSMKVKAASPVTDGIIMYSAESARGYGGFTALTVHNGRIEFIYDLGDGSRPVVLTSNKTLPANEWTDVHIVRVGAKVTLTINLLYNFNDLLETNKNDLNFETPMFVGGADDSIVLNKNTGVTGGFRGCIKDVMVFGLMVDIVGSSIQSANVQECSNYDRGDIPESESICSLCRNGGECTADGTGCECPPGFTGQYCESRAPRGGRASDPCALQPCRNGGTCRRDLTNQMNYTCDCRLGFAGATCQMTLELRQSVAFNGNGYLELPANQLRYENLAREPALIAMAFYTNSDGVLLYQREVTAPVDSGDFILIRIENGFVVVDWNLGGGLSTVTIDDTYVADLGRHLVIVKMLEDGTIQLTVDQSTRTANSTGFSNVMNADSNIYIGGIPDTLNMNQYPGLSGCVEQIELMGSVRGINLGQEAVAGRNTQRCRNLGA